MEDIKQNLNNEELVEKVVAEEPKAPRMTAKKLNIIFTSIILFVGLVYTIITGITFYNFSHYETYFIDEENDGYEVETLAKYNDLLEGTLSGDTKIYIKKGPDVPANLTPEQRKNYPSMLILGGTHPNEPSSQLTTALILNNLEVHGKTIVYVITEANRSAFTHSHPQEASAFYYNIKTQDGSMRTFKFGSRMTNTNQQWPNPDIYTNQFGGKLSNAETRNLNRAYPGVKNGTYTERVAYGITEFIRQNDIKVTFDLHEASPEYITINAIVSHQISAPIGAMASVLMEGHDVVIGAEKSPENLHGLTHRELGDNTLTLAFLAETSNASQGKIRGAFTEELITYEKPDKFYEHAWEETQNGNKLLYGQCVPINVRVARHALTAVSLKDAYNIFCDEGFEGLEFEGYGYKNYEGDRKEFLKSCGPIEFDLNLESHMPEGAATEILNTEGVAVEHDDIYNLLLAKGVGYFLDPDKVHNK